VFGVLVLDGVFGGSDAMTADELGGSPLDGHRMTVTA
jgi:hypothetical protein